MLISLNQFIQFFQSKNSETFAKFMKNANVMLGTGKLVPLHTYAKDHDIPANDLQVLYYHIIERNEYLERFYNKSLRPILPLTISETPMTKTNMNNDVLPNYKNIIRNMHMRDILQKTKSGLENLPSFMDVLFLLYKKEIIDYKILTPSARHYTNEGRIGSVFSSFYFRASIMNPYLVFSLCQKILCDKENMNTRVFSPTLGWTSYAYGFLECPMVTEYVATDVIEDVCRKTSDFCKKNYSYKKTQIYCEPSENLYKNSAFMKKYSGHFDIVFFSPPYYELELYPGKEQSTTMYKSYDEWLASYWAITVELCWHVLKKGGRMCYILSSYGCSGSAKCANSEFDILKDMNATVAQKFGNKGMAMKMKNKNVHVTSGSHRETGERIMIFVK